MCGNTTSTSALHKLGSIVPDGLLPYDASKVGPGVELVNREGYPVRILGTLAGNVGGRVLITATLTESGDEFLSELFVDGLYWHDGDTSDRDVFLRPTKKHITKYANVYSDETIDTFDTEELARAGLRADKHCVNPATMVRYGYFDIPAPAAAEVPVAAPSRKRGAAPAMA